MLVLLPPSETKRDGGEGGPLELGALQHPKLGPRRRTVLRAVRALAKDRDATLAALKLGPRQAAEVDRNRAITTSPTMPAIDRYTGVLYDALDAATLTEEARRRAGDTVRISSALFGLTGALDPIPAYRLSHDSRLPELPLKAHWSAAVAAELRRASEPILDLRSEGYVALGPAPMRQDSVYLRVLTEGEGGALRALNHFNKHGKGLFVRALLQAPEPPATIGELLEWAAGAGIDLRAPVEGELHLVLHEERPA